jgi:hypothetical protein
MKKFVFSLDRILAWRRPQARREEIKLAHLHAEHHALDARRLAVAAQRDEAAAEVIALPRIAGDDLGALNGVHRHAAAEGERIAQARAGCERQIAVQTEVLTAHSRRVTLLEKIKQRRLSAWSQEMDREINQQAEESHLAKWNRENR